MTSTALSVDIVPSFIHDAWWTPDQHAVSADNATEVRDASTGELLAMVSTSGLDTADVVSYARTTGQSELGNFTFHQRALKLKALAQFLNGQREHLYELSARTGG